MINKDIEIAIGNFTWKVNSRQLTLGKNDGSNPESKSTVLTPKQYQLLKCLYDAYPDTVQNDQIIESVWGSKHTSPESLPQLIIRTRQAIGDVDKSILVNEPGVGYSLNFKTLETKEKEESVTLVEDGALSNQRKKNNHTWYFLIVLLTGITLYNLWNAGEALFNRFDFIKVHQLEPYPDMEQSENGNVKLKIDNHDCVYSKDKLLLQC